MNVREAAVAGYFYPATADQIEDEIESYKIGEQRKIEAFGAVVPHAGYKYSGRVAAQVYSRIIPKGSLILIGPNHGGGRGFEPPPKAAAMEEGIWILPTGPAKVDSELAQSLLDECAILENAPSAHELEHSLEVQIPLLRHFVGIFDFVPIVVSHLSVDDVFALADGLIRGVEKYGKGVTVIASSDFSHYIPHKVAKEKDRMAIDAILAMDAKRLLNVVAKEGITMCGYQPTAVMLELCKSMGATKAELVDYKTSGDTSGDYSSVVGYGGLIIS